MAWYTPRVPGLASVARRVPGLPTPGIGPSTPPVAPTPDYSNAINPQSSIQARQDENNPDVIRRVIAAQQSGAMGQANSSDPYVAANARAAMQGPRMNPGLGPGPGMMSAMMARQMTAPPPTPRPPMNRPPMQRPMWNPRQAPTGQPYRY